MLTLLTDDWREGFVLQRSLADFQIEFEIEETHSPRIHAEKCAQVAAFTARWGANELKQPVLKIEKGLFIPALKGFPGTYWEEWQQKIGAAAIIKLMEEKENRSAQLFYVLAYCEPGKEPQLFEGGSKGAITTELPKGKHDLIESLYVPEYRLLNKEQTLTLAELEKSDPALIKHAWGDAEEQFAKWYKGRSAHRV